MFFVFLYLEMGMERPSKGKSNGGRITTYQKRQQKLKIIQLLFAKLLLNNETYKTDEISINKEQCLQGLEKTVLSSEEERQLATCIEKLCSLGFSPTRRQVIDLVKDYVTLHKLNASFKENRPGKEWLINFLRRNSLKQKSQHDKGRSHSYNKKLFCSL